MDETKPPGFGFMWLSVEKKQKEIREGVGVVAAAAIAPPVVHARPSCPPLFTLARPCSHSLTLVHAHPSCLPLFALALTYPCSCLPLLAWPACLHLFVPSFMLAAPCLACLSALVLVPLVVLGVAPAVPLITLFHVFICANPLSPHFLAFVPACLFDLRSGSFVLIHALLSFGGALCVFSSSCLCLYQIQS